MLDHVTIGVRNVERSKLFYDAALKPLGIDRLYAEGEAFAGYGIGSKAFFWIGQREEPQTGTHVAFATEERDVVDRFHRPRWLPAASTTECRVCARTITPATMAPSYLIRMATISRPYVTCR